MWDKAHEEIAGGTSRSARSSDHAAFRRCFAERAPREKGFADLVRQAQDIVDKLPVK